MKLIVLIFTLLFLTSCASTQFDLDKISLASSGLFPTKSVTEKAELIKSDNLDFSKYNDFAFVQIYAGGHVDFLKGLLIKSNLFKNVYNETDFSDFLINVKRIDTGSISDLVGLHEVETKLGPFFFISMYLNSDNNVMTLTISVFDTVTGKQVFHEQRSLTENPYYSYDELLFFPMFNSLIGWFHGKVNG